MPDNNSEKDFVLQPSWKCFFFSYIFAIITIPIAGIGLIWLYYLRKKHRSYQYIMTDEQVTAIDQKYEHHVDLVDIKHIDIRRSWFQEKLEIGTLNLSTSASNMEIVGIQDPAELKNILERAILVQTEKEQEKPEPTQPEQTFKPGSRGKIDYLTSLWQQGLLSDRDYREERNQLE